MTVELPILLNQDVLELENVKDTIVETLVELQLPAAAEWVDGLTIVGPDSFEGAGIQVHIGRYDAWSVLVLEVPDGQ